MDREQVLLVPNDAAFHLRAVSTTASVLMVATGVPRAEGRIQALPRLRPWPRQALVHHNEVLRIVARTAGALRSASPERDSVVLLVDATAGGPAIRQGSEGGDVPRGARWIELIEQRPQAGRGPVQPY